MLGGLISPGNAKADVAWCKN